MGLGLTLERGSRLDLTAYSDAEITEMPNDGPLVWGTLGMLGGVAVS